MKGTVGEVLQFEVRFDFEKSAVNVKTMQAVSNMKPLNTFNWQSLIYHFGLQHPASQTKYTITVKALPDYEGIVIGLQFLAIKKDPKQYLYLDQNGNTI